MGGNGNQSTTHCCKPLIPSSRWVWSLLVLTAPTQRWMAQMSRRIHMVHSRMVTDLWTNRARRKLTSLISPISANVLKTSNSTSWIYRKVNFYTLCPEKNKTINILRWQPRTRTYFKSTFVYMKRHSFGLLLMFVEILHPTEEIFIYWQTAVTNFGRHP